MLRALALLLALGLGISGAGATPFQRYFHGHPHAGGGGGGGGGGGVAHVCDGGSSVCADHANGQTFVTWTDTATGAAGASYRYRLVRSTTGPIDAGNYTAATTIASYIFNNSAQLMGGDPATGGTSYTQAHRQAASPGARIPDAQNGGTKQLAYGQGLQVYTPLASGTAYYAVIATDTSNANPVFLGAVGPVTETAAAPQDILYAHRTTGYGYVTALTGLPLVFSAHASNSGTGGAAGAGNSIYGDYWEQFGTTAEGYQDGNPSVFVVQQDGHAGTSWPSLPGGAAVFQTMDTIWSPDGLGGIETNHFGVGLTPNPLVGPANRLYRSTWNREQRQLAWIVNNYGIDPNRLHQVGQSMGGWGGARTYIRWNSPYRFASQWLRMPVWRFDLPASPGSGNWCGESWSGTQPFRATLGTGLNVCGTDPTQVFLDDGTQWGGTGQYADTPAFVQASPGTDLPFIVWSTPKYDDYISAAGGLAGFGQHVVMAQAMAAAHRGFAFCWTTGKHGAPDPGAVIAPIDYDISQVGTAYKKSQFALNVPYVAFANKSNDDNPGTGTKDANGIYDGDYVGCINAGNTWNVASDTASGVSLTVGNSLIGAAATLAPQTAMVDPVPSSGGTGTAYAITAGGGFQSTATNPYFILGGTEIVMGTISGNTFTLTARAQLGTVSNAHSAGDTLRQVMAQATGPNAGPKTSITTDIALRRLQGWHPANGPVSCTVTPNGETGAPATATVTNGIPVLTGVKINASGVTSVTCN